MQISEALLINKNIEEYTFLIPDIVLCKERTLYVKFNLILTCIFMV